ncbi:MAG: hypothetical protein CMJ18_25495 [Phycisphaeraceae bacterium]|nr:hypothetical protein [Phycisphaeraceae bacterium]
MKSTTSPLSRGERAFESRLLGKMLPASSPWPGIAVCVILTVVAYSLHALPFPPLTTSDGRHPISAVLLAVLLGMLLRHLVPGAARLKTGLTVVVKRWLPVGIVLLGAGLDFKHLLTVTGTVLVGAALMIALTLLLALWLARRFDLPEKMGLMIGMGTAICGSSAVVASAAVLEADDEEVTYSIGIINLLGVLAMLAFPLVGNLLSVPAEAYGAWCGLSIHATPQVIAAGFAHAQDGQLAGETATLVKLVRVAMLGPCVFLLGAWQARRQRRDATYVGRPVGYARLVPWFVILFVGLALARTLGLLPEVTLHLPESSLLGSGEPRLDLAALLSQAGKWIMTCALAAVGLSTQLGSVLQRGSRPVIHGVLIAVAVAVMGIAIAS